MRGALLLLVMASLPAHADDAPPTPFDQGRVSLSAGGGTAFSLGYHYLVIGGGVGYYALDGVELSLRAMNQFAENDGRGLDVPDIVELSPQLRYVAQPLARYSPFVPYVGVFYNHWFIGGDYRDFDAIGARAGALLVSGNVVLGLGVVFEHVLTTCDSEGPRCVHMDDSVYPDITLGFTI